MITKRKNAPEMSALPIGIGIGIFAAMLITVLFSAVIGWMISAEHLQESAINAGVMVVQLLSSIVGATIAYTLVRHRRMLVCLSTGCGYYLLLVACTALFLDGRYEGLLASGLMILIGSLSVALLGLLEKRGGKVNGRKIRNR